MKAKPTQSADDISGDISALIETLLRTEKQLEDLTAGEVDTVANRDGRMILLRRSQDHLRRNEAARQAAVLNALPAHIAMLDAQGVITFVNDAWRQFAHGNAMQSATEGVGENYLDICDRAQGSDAPEAHRAAAGIRSVMQGSARGFSMEYPCDSPSQSRWFLLTVAPLAGAPPAGAVVMHLDMTQQRHDKDILRESERRFSDILANVQLVSVMVDSDARITYCNDFLLRLTGWSREEMMGQNAFDFLIPPEVDDIREVFAALLANRPEVWHHENTILTRSAARRLIHWNNTVLRSPAGDVIGVASIGEDITDRKQTEHRVLYLSRVYAMLSGINALIVRVNDKEELFREACQVAVEAGGFRMSLIAMLDEGTGKIAVKASAGKDEHLLAAINGILASSEGAQTTMIAQAIRQKKTLVSNESRHDARLVLGAKYAESGVRSMAVVPLIVAEQAVGVLALYAGENDFFHDDELKLVTELAGDIAFAIDHLNKQERLDYLAYFDALTGLANRNLFLDRVGQYVHSAASGGHKLAVFLVDLERFKDINDSLGRPVGDALLRQVAALLVESAGDANLVARLQADQFGAVLPDINEIDAVARTMEKTIATFLGHSFQLDETEFRVGIKIGVTVFPDDGADADILFKNAEAALKKAKTSGERYLFYTQSMSTLVAGKVTLENQLRQALEKGEFVLHYQPKVAMEGGRLTGVEALIRWNDPGTGLVAPARFIPILEETGLIHDVGRWALHQAIETYLRWRAAGLPAVRIAVNVSPLQLRSRDFIGEISRAIAVDAQAAAGLELEITESLIMADVQHSIVSLLAIRALGVTIAIDDFGTGFSSLSYLAELPVDTLKIDRSFVVNMTAGSQGLALMSTIISLARALKLKVVAEGVETEEQARLLRLLNCDDMQGFLVCKPLPIDLFESAYLGSAAGT